jgi:cytosine/adenosine deaminase-related metal-dependent hydrolase
MDYVSGEILTGEGFIKGHIGFEKRNIIEIRKKDPLKKPLCKGLIIPTFVNAHTHIGDSFIKNKKIKLPKNIEKLVAPPIGLKHKLLNDADETEIIKGMEKSIEIMINSGTNYFYDFREGGLFGINLLKKSLQNYKISSLIFSRPESMNYDKNEINLLLKNSEGIGVSSSSDWDYSELLKISKHVKRKNKFFALHASERIQEDINKILDLKPNFLIHMIKANESDFEICKQENIPIVICPRSNSFFKMKPKYDLLKSKKVEVLIGTDNAMLNSPNILDEIQFIRRQTKVFKNEELLRMATINPRKALNLDCCIPCPNSKANFVVLDKKSLKPLYISVNK